MRLLLRSPAGSDLEVEALVDTGFWGYLTLSPAVVASVSFPFASAQRVDFADGRSEFVPLHAGTIVWHGTERSIDVLAMGTQALVGMSLLDGSDLRMHVTEGGAFAITPFADVP